MGDWKMARLRSAFGAGKKYYKRVSKRLTGRPRSRVAEAALPGIPFFEARKKTKFYSIKETKGWKYKDAKRFVVNPIEPMYSELPHIVLRDSKGAARFVLRYGKKPFRGSEALVVYSTQRTRTAYMRRLPFWSEWSPEMETAKSKEFQKQLGMHPAEFLLSEFIYRHRDEIMKGTPVLLRIAKGFHPIDANIEMIYLPLVERFFKKLPVPAGANMVDFELNLQKRRVKEILGAR